MFENLAEMVGTLQKSAAGILDYQGDDRQKLLEKSFQEFQAELQKNVEGAQEAIQNDTLAQLEAEGALALPLYKGLGAVGAIASLFSMAASRVSCIIKGIDYEGQTTPPANSDPASPEVAEMLEHWLAMGELILRQAVNEHVEPLEEGDDLDDLGPDVHLIVLPHPDHEDDDESEHHVVGKAALPEDLLKFAIHPDAMVDAAFALGVDTLGLAGVDGEQLVKAIETGALAKAAPPGAAAAGGDAGVTPGGDPGDGSGDGSGVQDDGSGDGDDDPLDVLMRILALALVQADKVKQMLDPAGPGLDGDPDDVGDDGNPLPGNEPDPNADDPAKAAPTGALAKGAQQEAGTPPAAAANPVQPDQIAELRKVAGAGMDAQLAELRKLAPEFADAIEAQVKELAGTKDELAAQFAEAEGLIKTWLAQPEAPKGVAKVMPVTKADDTTGALAKTDTPPEGGATVGADGLKKSAPDDVVLAKIKASLAKPM